MINALNCRLNCGHPSTWTQVDPLTQSPSKNSGPMWGTPPTTFGEMLEKMWDSISYADVCYASRLRSVGRLNRYFAKSRGFWRISLFGWALKFHDVRQAFVPFSSRVSCYRATINDRFRFSLVRR